MLAGNFRLSLSVSSPLTSLLIPPTRSFHAPSHDFLPSTRYSAAWLRLNCTSGPPQYDALTSRPLSLAHPRNTHVLSSPLHSSSAEPSRFNSPRSLALARLSPPRRPPATPHRLALINSCFEPSRSCSRFSVVWPEHPIAPPRLTGTSCPRSTRPLVVARCIASTNR